MKVKIAVFFLLRKQNILILNLHGFPSPPLKTRPNDLERTQSKMTTPSPGINNHIIRIEINMTSLIENLENNVKKFENNTRARLNPLISELYRI